VSENKPLTKAQRAILDTAVAIRHEASTIEDVAFLARQFVQATLPHSDPKSDTWRRVNGNFALGIQAGFDPETGTTYGVPYGVIPRLLLFWITTEAVRTKNPRLVLGASPASGRLRGCATLTAAETSVEASTTIKLSNGYAVTLRTRAGSATRFGYALRFDGVGPDVDVEAAPSPGHARPHSRELVRGLWSVSECAPQHRGSPRRVTLTSRKAPSGTARGRARLDCLTAGQ
jgi:hypothetical protein